MKNIINPFQSVMIYSCSNQQTGTTVEDSDELSLNAKSLLQAYFDNDFVFGKNYFQKIVKSLSPIMLWIKSNNRGFKTRTCII